MRRWELVLRGQVRQYSGRGYFRVPGAAQRGGTNGIPAKQKEKGTWSTDFRPFPNLPSILDSSSITITIILPPHNKEEISRSRRSRRDDPPLSLSLFQSPLLSFLVFRSFSQIISFDFSRLRDLKLIEFLQRSSSSSKGGTKGAHEITSGRYLIAGPRKGASLRVRLVRRRRPTDFLRYAAAVATRRAASRRVVARAYLPVPVCPPDFPKYMCVCTVRSLAYARYEIRPVPLRCPSSKPAPGWSTILRIFDLSGKSFTSKWNASSLQEKFFNYTRVHLGTINSSNNKFLKQSVWDITPCSLYAYYRKRILNYDCYFTMLYSDIY